LSWPRGAAETARGLALCAALLAAAGAPRAGSAQGDALPEVERVSERELRIRWPAEFSPGPVRLHVGPAPERIDRRHALGVAQGAEVTLRAAADAGSLGLEQRLFFELVPEGAARGVVVAERRLPLVGARNFRDLGGYASADGRRVRWGRLFRSDDLAGLSAEDLAQLRRLGLRLVCDLRSQKERAAEPNRGVGDLEQLALPVAEQGVAPHFVRNEILSGGIAALAMERVMLQAYRDFATEHTQVWATLLRRLADPAALPGLVHCSVGKDRTGFAAALVLLALGVPRETVFADYLLSNHYLESWRRSLLRWVPIASLFRAEPADLAPILEARPEYLEAALEAIDERHGSFERYLSEALGLDAALRAALEANLLH
jgi:protein-tyrosine phosphatase